MRLLVKGELPKGGAPRAEFTLSGTREPIDGVLERTFATARVGRSGRAQVASDHVSEFHSATIAPGATALRLDRVVGKLGGPIQVFAYRHWLTPTELVLLSLLVLFLVAAVDAWAGLQGNTAVASGMALAFGLLVASYATPFASVGQALGGAVLGAMTGALAGSIAGAVMRKFVPQGRRRAGGGKAGNGKPGSKTDSAAAA